MIIYKPFPKSLRGLNLVCHLRLIEISGDRIILYGDENQCPMEYEDREVWLASLSMLQFFKLGRHSFHVWDYTQRQLFEIPRCDSAEKAYLMLANGAVPVNLRIGA